MGMRAYVRTLILASRRLNMGAFLSMSGMIMNLTLLPLMKTCSSCDTLPSCRRGGENHIKSNQIKSDGRRRSGADGRRRKREEERGGKRVPWR